MKKIKNNLPNILICLVIVLLLVIIWLLLNMKVFNYTNVNSNKDSSSDKKEIVDKKEEVNGEIKEEEKAEKPVVTPAPNNQPVAEKNELNVISYFEQVEKDVPVKEDKKLSEKVKSGFVSVVDFIFYDKEIKGYKFKELTNEAKLKVISIALAIDSKIDKYFPNYKDKIKGTYTNVKEKLAVKYLEYSEKLCETVGEDTCNQVKESWQNLKENFSLAGDYLKELGKAGGSKLKDWYEKFREN